MSPRSGALIAAVVVSMFGRAVGFPFVNWDDYERIVGRPWIVDPFGRPLLDVLLTPELGYPQPLTVLSQALDWRVGDGSAWPLHLTNVALHLGNVLLVAHVSKSYGVCPRYRVLSALLFALHPIVVEPVCWATGRKDLLATLGVLAGFLAYRRGRRAGPAAGRVVVDTQHLGLVTLGFAVAIGGKPVGIVLVPLVLSDLLLTKRWPDKRFAAVLVAGVFASMALVVVSYRLHVRIDGVERMRDPVLSFAYVSQHLALHLRNIVHPVDLAPLYLDLFPRPLGSAWGISGIVVTAGFATALALAVRRDALVVALGLSWAVIAFLPSSGLVPLVRGPADSYFYLPWVGLCLAAGGAAERWAQGNRAPRAAALGMGAAVVASAFVTWTSVDRFSSSAALWRPMLARYPEQPASHQNYGDALILDGRAARAVPHLARALELSAVPETPEGMETLALACAAIGDHPCATRWWGAVVRHFPLTVRRAWLLAGAAAVADDPRYRDEIERSRRRVQETMKGARRDSGPIPLNAAIECRLGRAALRHAGVRLEPDAARALFPPMCAEQNRGP